MLYLCFLWCWTNRIAFRAGIEMIEGVTPDQLLDGSLHMRLSSLLADYEHISQPWTWNHRVRLFTSLTLATVSLVHLIERFYQHQDGSTGLSWDVFWYGLIPWPLILYASTLLTAWAPAIVNKRLFAGLAKKLDESCSDVDDPHLRQEATMMLLRLSCLQGTRGMHFMGIYGTASVATAVVALVHICLVVAWSTSSML